MEAILKIMSFVELNLFKMKPINLTEHQITDIINRFRFLERNTVKNISEDTGISQSRVNKIINDFLSEKIK